MWWISLSLSRLASAAPVPTQEGGKPGVAVTPVCHPPLHGSCFSLALSWASVVSSFFSFFFFSYFFLNQRPLTPRVVRQCQPLLLLLCSRSWVCFRRAAQAPGLLQLMGASAPSPAARLGSVGSQHFSTHSSEQPAHASIGNWAHSPAPSASPWILHWTPPSNYLFLLFCNRHFSPFFIAAFVL